MRNLNFFLFLPFYLHIIYSFPSDHKCTSTYKFLAPYTKGVTITIFQISLHESFYKFHESKWWLAFVYIRDKMSFINSLYVIESYGSTFFRKNRSWEDGLNLQVILSSREKDRSSQEGRRRCMIYVYIYIYIYIT